MKITTMEKRFAPPFQTKARTKKKEVNGGFIRSRRKLFFFVVIFLLDFFSLHFFLHLAFGFERCARIKLSASLRRRKKLFFSFVMLSWELFHHIDLVLCVLSIRCSLQSHPLPLVPYPWFRMVGLLAWLTHYTTSTHRHSRARRMKTKRDPSCPYLPALYPGPMLPPP